jgi:hypothetical protein
MPLSRMDGTSRGQRAGAVGPVALGFEDGPVDGPGERFEPQFRLVDQRNQRLEVSASLMSMVTLMAVRPSSPSSRSALEAVSTRS